MQNATFFINVCLEWTKSAWQQISDGDVEDEMFRNANHDDNQENQTTAPGESTGTRRTFDYSRASKSIDQRNLHGFRNVY